MRRARFVALGPSVMLVVWGIVSYGHMIDELFLPTPGAVSKALWEAVAVGSALPDVGMTMTRWLAGLGAGIVIGIPLGVGMGASQKVYALLEVVIDFFRSVPTISLFPLFLVFFGIGDLAKISIAAWATSLSVLINTLYGVRNVKEARVKVAKVLRANRWQILSKVIIPDALPSIVVGIRIALSMSLVVVVASEMIMGTTKGLGRRIFDAALIYEMPDMYAAIIVAGMLGYLSNKLFAVCENRFVHWASK